ncbi:co-chaperone YbbN [Aphanothece hegewaldii CCALA 016]|uniref:Co-chaperone YbbN n=1 Tax=Aphanothece hegewaldii CCALA 016 TaxID=2107694 RepID=A0A2T1M1U3_9CHRO|nr:tetratricopeptide repeat protein [Aphanothece hegewaldii]PSF38686.1 co-chaperone YbbN [Aphanothece hegewaldii CCALA 016]
MGYSIDINTANFATEVLEKSYNTLIIADFYATWCGPCQLLKPSLEKLVKEYNFVLAKIDIDQNPELANQFDVEGVPDVRVFDQGEISPGFVGALSESQLREFLGKLNLKSYLDLALEKIKELIVNQNYQEAKLIFDELFQKYPNDNRLVIEAARFLIKIKQIEAAEKLLQTIPDNNKEYYPKAQAIKTLIEFKNSSEFIENELDKNFNLASELSLSDNMEEALQLFLNIVQQNRKYRNDAARKAMIAIFNLIGMEHPLTKKYQRDLMMSLY